MDPLTLTIEICGIVILLVWLVIPVQEFKHILTGLRKSGHLNNAERNNEETLR